jgi:Uma2 family endonuclease
MSMATAIFKPTREADGDQCVAFPDIGWKGYAALLRLRGERSWPRMVYLDGTGIPFVPAGSTTLRRRARKGGVEGDQTFYLANEARIRGKHKIDLRTDPPPDLAMEAVYSHDAEAAVEVYRRFRVPEVWVCDEAELVILVLQPNGEYATSTTSAAFPFLSVAEVYERVSQPQTVAELEWVTALRLWVQRTLMPRVRRQAREAGGE